LAGSLRFFFQSSEAEAADPSLSCQLDPSNTSGTPTNFKVEALSFSMRLSVIVAVAEM
jgi:hypothetical protein